MASEEAEVRPGAGIIAARGGGSNAPLLVAIATALFAASGAALRPVWLDELYTLRLARLPVREIFRALETDSGPPGLYLIARTLFLVGRWPEGSALGIFLVRLPSIAGAALAAGVVTRAARERSPGRLPIAPLLLLLWLPFWYFASEARPYALLSAGVALTFLCGPEWLRRGGHSTWGFAATVGALPLLHNTGALYAAAAVPLILVVPGRAGRFRAAAIVLLSLLPFGACVPTLLHQPRESIAWMTDSRPGLATLGVLSPAGPFPRLVEPPDPIVPPVVSAAALGLLLVAMAGGALKSSRSGVTRTIPVALGLLPLAAILVSPLAGQSLYFPGRSEAAAMPLLAVLGGAAMPRRRIGMLALVPFAALAVPTLVSWVAALPSRPDPPGIRAAEELSGRLDRNDVVVACGLFELELRWGFGRATLRRRCEVPEVVPFPLALAQHPGWIGPADASPRVLAADRKRLAHALGIPGPRRVALVGSPLFVVPLRSLFRSSPETSLFESPSFVAEIHRLDRGATPGGPDP